MKFGEFTRASHDMNCLSHSLAPPIVQRAKLRETIQKPSQIKESVKNSFFTPHVLGDLILGHLLLITYATSALLRTRYYFLVFPSKDTRYVG